MAKLAIFLFEGFLLAGVDRKPVGKHTKRNEAYEVINAKAGKCWCRPNISFPSTLSFHRHSVVTPMISLPSAPTHISRNGIIFFSRLISTGEGGGLLPGTIVFDFETKRRTLMHLWSATNNRRRILIKGLGFLKKSAWLNKGVVNKKSFGKANSWVAPLSGDASLGFGNEPTKIR